MNRVFLIGARSYCWTPDCQMIKPTGFDRRMTALQKAVVQVFSSLEEQRPELIALARHHNAPIFYSSAYGESSAMLQVTQAIMDHDLPVSPKEFQHSVQNAALAYLTMTHSMHHPSFALSGGYLSGDSCLQLASQRIFHGLDSLAFVIHAHEYMSSSRAEHAQAEILLLSNQATDAGDFELEFCRPGSMRDFINEAPQLFQEQKTWLPPWLLHLGRPHSNRLASSLAGESLVTRWI